MGSYSGRRNRRCVRPTSLKQVWQKASPPSSATINEFGDVFAARCPCPGLTGFVRVRSSLARAPGRAGLHASPSSTWSAVLDGVRDEFDDDDAMVETRICGDDIYVLTLNL
eukprot:5799102-Pleurochrysis_carterae.AAC.1